MEFMASSVEVCAHSASSYYIYWRINASIDFNDNTMIKPDMMTSITCHLSQKIRQLREDTIWQMSEEGKQAVN